MERLRSGALEAIGPAAEPTLAGQGTLAAELDHQLPEVDTLLVAVGGGGDIHVVSPYSMIEPIRSILDAGVQSDLSEIDDRWSVLLKEELMHAKVSMSALFAEKELTVSDLINLQAGDIIPLDMPEQVMLLAEEMPVMKGQYGEHGGNAAIKVEDVFEIYDPESSVISELTQQEKQVTH